jgi:hypothetical protein
MTTINIEIINPKAKKLLQNLAALKLISIGKENNPFLEVVKKMRSQKAEISLDEITGEVDWVRNNRYGK